jgi:hypothetical protein
MPCLRVRGVLRAELKSRVDHLGRTAVALLAEHALDHDFLAEGEAADARRPHEHEDGPTRIARGEAGASCPGLACIARRATRR